MALKDGTGTPFVTFHRPFKCDPCYAPPCCSCVNQEMSMDAAGQPVTSAKEVTGMCCTTGCCNRKFETYDASGKLMYTMEINDCNSKSGGTNLCAPTCFNEALTVDVTDANGNLLPPSTFVWPGCNWFVWPTACAHAPPRHCRHHHCHPASLLLHARIVTGGG